MARLRSGRQFSLAPLVEFGLIGTACALAYFWLIPTQISSTAGVGLSPDLLPRTCVVAIAVLATVNLLTRLRTAAAVSEAPPLRYVAGILAAVAVGVVGISYAGLVAGGTIMVVAVTLVLGERRPLRLALHAGGAAFIMGLIPALRL